MDLRKEHQAGLPSVGWAIVLLIGIGLGWDLAGTVLGLLASQPIQWDEVGRDLADLALILPFIVVAWILRPGRLRKMPSLAFVVTVLTGGFIFLFSLGESIIGFMPPYEPSEAIGGLIEVATFSLPFLIIAWLLWIRPKIGASLLVCVGVAAGIWLTDPWSIRTWREDWIGVLVLFVLPIALGLYTLIKELRSGKAPPVLENAS